MLQRIVSSREGTILYKCCVVVAALMAIFGAKAQAQTDVYGPYRAVIASGGPGLHKTVAKDSPVLAANAAWTMTLWVQANGVMPDTLIAGVGNTGDLDSRFIGIEGGHVVLRLGAGNKLIAETVMPAGGWHFLAATEDAGVARLFVDGKEVASSSRMLLGKVAPVVLLAPSELPDGFVHFGGAIAQFEVVARSFSPQEIAESFAKKPDFSMDGAEAASKAWPVQTKGMAGMLEPQDASLMPHGREPLQHGVAKPLPQPGPTLREAGAGNWQIAANWQLAFAKEVPGSGVEISSTGAGGKWLAATVPGTILTTLIDRGVYPDPDFGLNNLAIPESLNKQEYWYRVSFPTPQAASGRHVQLTFNGINYAAEVWLNGSRVGDIKGAFLRGMFDVTSLLAKHGVNELAVRVSPPPHPGIPEEESLKAGPGPNGGVLCLDGPTFVATEGWDWIPSIRDRNTGIWQSVVLSVSDALQLGDPQVVTRLPLPQTSSADVEISVPVNNTSSATMNATVVAKFEGVSVSKTVAVAPGATVVALRPAEFPQLHIDSPRLWWPNGYGKPELYHLTLRVNAGDETSDSKQMTFGIREISYELSLFDRMGALKRVMVTPAEAVGTDLVNVTHEGMRQTAHGWAATLTAVGETSAAVKTVNNADGLTDLVIRVNGVRIAARGGNWGMDDSRKRVSREHLEPYFRMYRDANLNIIRNWISMNDEEMFYQLADEYGMMVWNDFWTSTQDYNLEVADPALFLKNARDVISRFRNHPSIVVWCGRNEGVPQPSINEGMIALFHELDGTRYYTPSSREVNLRGSGPYTYVAPVFYYGKNNQGFSVELGTPSFSTLESFQRWIAPADQWPISDAWAYHDWHQTGGGDVHPWMDKLEEEFGAGTDLKDFERKAQMLNYVNYRAIFEGFNQHLFTPNAGRLLWMTQPAWPSNHWQILNSDYDTSAAYYGVKKACEPIHVQLDLTNLMVTLVNTTGEASEALSVTAKVYSFESRLLWTKRVTMEVGAGETAKLFPLEQAGESSFVRLEARDATGRIVSDNFYWLSTKDSGLRALTRLGAADVDATAATSADGVEVRLRNRGTVAALELKLVARDAAGKQVLPAYFNDNYLSLLPGEERVVTLRDTKAAEFGLRGWNLAESVVKVK